MKLSATQNHSPIRMGLILVITGLIDAIVAWFAPHPFVWATLIGASLPLSTAHFVVSPMLSEAKQKP